MKEPDLRDAAAAGSLQRIPCTVICHGRQQHGGDGRRWLKQLDACGAHWQSWHSIINQMFLTDMGMLTLPGLQSVTVDSKKKGKMTSLAT